MWFWDRVWTVVYILGVFILGFLGMDVLEYMETSGQEVNRFLAVMIPVGVLLLFGSTAFYRILLVRAGEITDQHIVLKGVARRFVNAAVRHEAVRIRFDAAAQQGRSRQSGGAMSAPDAVKNMTAPRRLVREQVDDDQYLVWNEYVDILAMSDYVELTETQQAAHLVFWYESEVQNGGHLQYFHNQGDQRVRETIRALKRLGADCQSKVLARAVKQYASKPRTRIESAEEYAEEALEGEFDKLDRAFHACQPPLIEALEAYLQKHQPEFVVVEN
jgi:hypothetical protein